jgi:hypothetical protein
MISLKTAKATKAARGRGDDESEEKLAAPNQTCVSIISHNHNHNHNSTKTQTQSNQCYQFYLSFTVVFTAFAIAIAIAIGGLYLAVDTRRKLYHGDTCEMTYSGVRYLQIPWIVKQEETETEEKQEEKSLAHDQYFCSMTDPSVAISKTSSNGRSSSITSRYRLMQFQDYRDDRFNYWSNNKNHKSRKQDSHNNIDQDGALFCQNEQDLLEPMWNPGHPVLFVPGHWGSFEQARSLGAHGIQMTEQRKVPAALRKRLHHLRYGNHSQALYYGNGNHSGDQDDFENNTIKSRDSFVFDVYTLDFKEESSALHGFMLWEQSEIIQHAIRSIVHRIEMSLALQQQHQNTNVESVHMPIVQVTIVGHSIGGVVAAGAFLPPPKKTTARELSHSSKSKQMNSDHSYHSDKHSYLSQHVSSIVTLATPHTFPIAPDPSVRQFYNAVHKYWKTYDEDVESAEAVSKHHPLPTIVSISGGFRDELIHPSWCSLDALLPQTSGITVSAKQITNI